jgi:hypothetical protein
MMQDWLTNYCNGLGPHLGPKEVRLMPLGGGGNAILCLSCWAEENKFRFDMSTIFDPKDWPQHNFFTSKIYATENEGVTK